jgi:hypothetical protein
MKVALMVSALTCMATASACCQTVPDASVPEAAKTACMQKFPSAKGIKWEKENGNYEANWGGKSGEDHSVQFTSSGNFVEMEIAINPHQLPAAAVSYVKKHYTGTPIREAGKITDARGSVTYEAEIHGKDLIFDSRGNFVKTGSGD